jgi:hypothetical protein
MGFRKEVGEVSIAPPPPVAELVPPAPPVPVLELALELEELPVVTAEVVAGPVPPVPPVPLVPPPQLGAARSRTIGTTRPRLEIRR